MGQHLMVGSQCDCESVTLVDARLHSRIERNDRALGLCERLGKLDFELCNLMPHMCDSGEDTTWQQVQSELVRVLKNACVVDRQARRLDDRCRRSQRTRNL